MIWAPIAAARAATAAATTHYVRPAATIAGGFRLSDLRALPVTDEEPFPLVRRVVRNSGIRVLGVALP